MATSTQEQEATEAVGRTGMDPAVVASIAAIALSWYEFFVAGNREMGLFVGLWPPTFLAFGSYFKQSRMSDTLDRALGKGSFMDSVERMIQSR